MTLTPTTRGFPAARNLRQLSVAAAMLVAIGAQMAQATPLTGAGIAWTYKHNSANSFNSEIVTFDSSTQTLWVAGVSGVDVLNAKTGAFVQRIDTSALGSVNSVAIQNGVAALAIESSVRTQPGVVHLLSTSTRSPLAGTNTITVGALPDMLTFTPDGSKLLIANEATPSTYGALTSATGVFPRTYGPAPADPAGSVSIINMATRNVTATAFLSGVAQSGSLIRTNTGMDFEPEYITVSADGRTAFVTLQEANAIGVLDINSGSFQRIIGLGSKDFNAPGNRIDPLNNNSSNLINVNARGLYMPDGIASFEQAGRTYLVMANEGDFREDDGDRSAASSLGAASPLNALRVSNTDSSNGNLFVAGARSFTIRDTDGNIVYDSGEILDREAIKAGIYDDGRSRDKGVEPEGIELYTVGGRLLAFVGLERTLESAIAVFDITDPASSQFLQLLVSPGDRSPEGLSAFMLDGTTYLAVANEVSGSTTVFKLAQVPVPGTLPLVLLAGLGFVAASSRTTKTKQ